MTVVVQEMFVIPQLLWETSPLPEPMKRMTALVKGGGYMTVNRFLNTLTDEELGEVLHHGMAARHERSLLDSMALFCAMMANHEGLVVLSTDKLGELVSRLMVLVQAEIMVRKGLVELAYSCLTLEGLNPLHMRITEKGKLSFTRIVLKRPPYGPRLKRLLPDVLLIHRRRAAGRILPRRSSLLHRP